MADLDVARLIKMLNMIGSSHDGEALNAARMAHAQLKAAGLTWEQLLRGAAAPRQQIKPKPSPGEPWHAAPGWRVYDETLDQEALREAIRRMQDDISERLRAVRRSNGRTHR